MTIRILHIFAPNFRQRFTGPVIQWRYYFNHWQEPAVSHFVLDTSARKILPGKEALNFELTSQHQLLTQFQRTAWILALFRSLKELEGSYDLLHVHLLWWGSLLLGPPVTVPFRAARLTWYTPRRLDILARTALALESGTVWPTQRQPWSASRWKCHCFYPSSSSERVK